MIRPIFVDFIGDPQGFRRYTSSIQTDSYKPFSCRKMLFHSLMSGMMDIGKASDVGHAVYGGLKG
jgi:hypothetical protein